jgi:NADH:ubiquinone oxidoreductase subunit F (NADH-binding)
VETVGASRAVVYIGRAHAAARSALIHAIRERRRLRLDPKAVEIVDAPDRYIAGETSALVHLLNGGPAKPTAVPPRPHESGVLGLPTLIQNAETTAHIALIARFGPEWFRQRGTDGSPGTALVTVSGAVAHPGVIEVDRGASIGAVIGAAGGLVTEAQAILLGGYFGTWLPAVKAWGMRLDDDELAQHGAAVGCGVILALPASSCAVTETARILRYLADESAGQCGPCIYGLRSIASAMERVACFRPDPLDLERLRRWAGQIAHRGACHHPDGAIRLLLSTLEVFSYDLWRHTNHQPCRGARAPSILPVAPMETGWR